MNKQIIRMVVALLLLIVAMPTSAAGIAARVQNPNNGHWYQRFDNTMTWHDAKAYCESNGGYLATITSQSEDDFVYSNLGSDSPFEMVWLGATDEAQEEAWEWVTSEVWEYTKWAGGEPNNCSGIEHYLVYFTPHDPLGRAGYWNDLGAGNNGGCGCGGCTDEWYPMSTICEWDSLQVMIDIKPGSDPNSINCNNEKGVIPVAILTTDAFDATMVDHTTVIFEGASETHVNDKTGEPRRHEEDVDGNGDIDLVFHFRLGDTDLTCDSTEGTLMGATHDGQAIEGTDRVRIVGRSRGRR